LLDANYSYKATQSLLRWRSTSSVVLYARQTGRMFLHAHKFTA
jgi:hypothetical protein